ncbi:hypothetical protein JJB99_07930 [Bradyrhizobium diazoefficiens]|uniref:hypothetical protein n=1 Tax=Bradyrhizobium diazoefficiens TaxID=1355477 RepID=UPI00190AECF6|nr:hypothetical protein [Bradyrhizobium diazoefficiens]QQO16072.1 hypothetical protein JJB99_07930 [Bradyrhizobium diazoefficiens]
MAENESGKFAHVIANIDTETGKGQIRYILPTERRTSSVEQAGPDKADLKVRLVFKDSTGKEIGRVQPELRFEACHEGEKPHRAIIQQDVSVTDALSQIELEYQGKTIDTFRAGSSTPVDQQFRETANFGFPLPGDHTKLSVGTPTIEARSGVSYMVQAKADNAAHWQTLSVGQSTPDFVVDKNQFPGASTLEVRVTQNAGFQSRTVDQRTIKLE